MQLPPRNVQSRPTGGESGSVLIEVVVTAALLIIVALGVLKALDAADARGAEQKTKAVAGNLAQAEQERLRSLPLDELSNYNKPALTVTQNNATYTVTSRASWVTDATGEASCETATAADYLKIETTVTSTSLRGRSPVTLNSILSPPARAFKQTEGSLAVKVVDRSGAPVPGLSLSLSGTENVSGITNSQGCVLWGYLTAAPDYNLSFSRAGWVDPAGTTAISSTQGVVGEQTRNVVFMYDQAGSLRTNFVTMRPVAGSVPAAIVPTQPGYVTIQHPGPPSTLRSFPMTGSSFDTPAVFPFNSDWAIYADSCVGARPATPKFKTVAPGPVTDAGQIQIPAIDILVVTGSTPVNGATVKVTSACGSKYTRTTATNGKLADPGFPFGTGYIVCAQSGGKFRSQSTIANTVLPSSGTQIKLDMAGAATGSCP